jgi:hypothetical protein
MRRRNKQRVFAYLIHYLMHYNINASVLQGCPQRSCRTDPSLSPEEMPLNICYSATRGAHQLGIFGDLTPRS